MVAIASGALQESSAIEFKREIPRNERVAKQLAAFAANGGALVIGVHETKEGTLELTPIDCRQARERIEHIAQSIPDPPVSVETFVFRTGGDGEGVLWVEIPASPHLLHQVGGTYYERGDTESRPMRDPDVQDRMALRADRGLGIKDALGKALARPEPVDYPIHGRTCVVARPVGAAATELHDASIAHEQWDAFAYSLMPGGLNLVQPAPVRYWGLVSHRFTEGGGRGSIDNFSLYCDLEFEENGAFSYISYSHDWTPGNSSGIYVPATIHACRAAVGLISAIHALTKQRRTWDLAFAISNVLGTKARGRGEGNLHQHLGISRSEYSQQLHGITATRLDEDARGVVQDLAARFVSACGLDFATEYPVPR